jgi:hypothetical protein
MDAHNIDSAFAKARGHYEANKSQHVQAQYHRAAEAHGGNANGFNMYVKERGGDLGAAARQWQADKGVYLNHEK